MEPLEKVTNDAHQPTPRPELGWGHPLPGLIPGLWGGSFMAVVLFLLAIAQEEAWYRPLLVIASTVVGSGAMDGGLGTAAIGLLVHLTVSAMLGMVFTTLIGRTTMVRMLGFGILYGVAIWATSQFVVLPLVNSLAALRVGLIGPFFLGNLGYGFMLAACAPTVKDIDAALDPDDVATEDELRRVTPEVMAPLDEEPLEEEPLRPSPSEQPRL